MPTGPGNVGQDYRYYFALRAGNGSARTGAAGSVTAAVRNPQDTATDSPAVTEVGATGQYYIDVDSTFTATHGTGQYGVFLEVTSAPRDTFSESITFISGQELASGVPGLIADAVWDEAVIDHVTLGTMGRAQHDCISGVPSQINDTIDGVWDEDIADHLTLGSTGRALNDSVSGTPVIDNSAIADAVWDEAVADHLTLGTMGRAQNDAVSGIPTIDNSAIADAVWDESIAGHLTDGTTGRALNDSVSGTPVIDNASIADAVWDEALSGHLALGTTGRAQHDCISGVPSQINDTINGVWDEDIVDHLTEGTMGRAQNDAVSGNSLAVEALLDDIADAVWEETASDHLTLNTTGRALNDAVSGNPIPPTVSEIADGVWDEAVSAHLTLGTMGRAQNDAVSGIPLTSEIADAVWNEPIAGHLTAGSTGAELESKAEPGDAMDLVTDAVDASAVATSGANEIRDSILSDSTPFAGANIDAAISTRAVPGDAMALTAGAVDDVWDEAISGHLTDGTTGRALHDAVSGNSIAIGSVIDDIADAVWDEPIADHLNVGSTGEALDNKAEPGDAMDLIVDALDSSSLASSAVDEIVDASWIEILPGANPLDSAGERLASIDDTVASIVANAPDEPFVITEATIDEEGEAIGKIIVDGVAPEGIVVAYADTDPDLTTALFSAQIKNDGGFNLTVDKLGDPIYRVTAVADGFTSFSVVRVQAT